MFRLSHEPLDPGVLGDELAAPAAGALVTFEGWVRDHHEGRPVKGLDYEAFVPMARRVGEGILAEARERFAITGAAACHRLGTLGVGDRAIWVGVTSAHRQEAFLACRWIMDAIKAEVPVWKKEHFGDGSGSVWVNAGEGSRSEAVDPAADERYARQVKLPGVGPEGQRRLAGAAVLVIGAGGLGCPALQYLAGAGIGRLTVGDGDRVDRSNLHRQVLFGTSDLGRNKAEAAADRLREQNDAISLRALPEAATPDNLPEWIAGHDVVIDGTDSFESKYAIADACWNAGRPLVQAGIYQVDGWVQVIDRSADAGCFRCQWPEPPPPGCVGNCAEAGLLGTTAGQLGVLQASQALQWLLGWHEGLLREGTLYVDTLTGTTRRIRRRRRLDCACASDAPEPFPATDHGVLFPGPRAEALLREATVVDLREVGTDEAAWADLLVRFPERPLVLCCGGGTTSRRCLAALGHPEGVYAWSQGAGEGPPPGVPSPAPQRD